MCGRLQVLLIDHAKTMSLSPNVSCLYACRHCGPKLETCPAASAACMAYLASPLHRLHARGQQRLFALTRIATKDQSVCSSTRMTKRLGPNHDFCKLQIASCDVQASFPVYVFCKNDSIYIWIATDRKKPASRSQLANVGTWSQSLCHSNTHTWARVPGLSAHYYQSDRYQFFSCETIIGRGQPLLTVK